MFNEDEVFHLGNDGIIHFTETHKNKRYDDFCIDMSADLKDDAEYDNTKTLDGPIVDSEGKDYYVVEEDYSYSDYQTGYDQEYNDTLDEEYYHDGHGGSNRSTCNVYPDPRPHTMVAMFCDYDFASLPKCCDKYDYLNLRYIFTEMINNMF